MGFEPSVLGRVNKALSPPSRTGGSLFEGDDLPCKLIACCCEACADMRYIRFLVPILVLWLASLTPSLGDDGRENARSRQITREEAATIARQHGNGRVLSLDRSSGGGREHYRAKVLSRRGVISTIQIDKDSGNLLPTPR